MNAEDEHQIFWRESQSGLPAEFSMLCALPARVYFQINGEALGRDSPLQLQRRHSSLFQL